MSGKQEAAHREAPGVIQLEPVRRQFRTQVIARGFAEESGVIDAQTWLRTHHTAAVAEAIQRRDCGGGRCFADPISVVMSPKRLRPYPGGATAEGSVEFIAQRFVWLKVLMDRPRIQTD